MRFLVLLLSVLLAACANNPPRFYYSKNGVVRVSASTSEINDARHTLLKMKPSSVMPSDMAGGVLFDGVVQTISVDGEGNHIATIKTETSILVASPPLPDVVEIITPPLGSGGIDFHEKKRYRVYAVKLEGRYQTWGLAGTVELPSQ